MRLLAAAFILFTATPALAWDQEGFRRDIAFVTASASADVAATSAALRACSGCREGNPLMTRHTVTGKALTASVVIWALHYLRSRGHDRLATIIRWVVVGVWSGAAAWNLTMAH
jgi:hypothetical protein